MEKVENIIMNRNELVTWQLVPQPKHCVFNMHSIFTGIVGWISWRFSLFYQYHMTDEISFSLTSLTVIQDTVCNSTTYDIPISLWLKFSFLSVLFPYVNTPTTTFYKTYKLKMLHDSWHSHGVTIIITTVVIIVITWVQHHASKTAILRRQRADFAEIPIMCYPMKRCCTQMKVQKNWS